jgi:hypothetical protein
MWQQQWDKTNSLWTAGVWRMLFRGFLPYPFLYILFEIARYQQWTIDCACRMKEGLQLLTIRSGAFEDYWGTLLAARTSARASRADEMEWISTGMPPSFPFTFSPLLITTDCTLILCDKKEGIPSRLLQWGLIWKQISNFWACFILAKKWTSWRLNLERHEGDHNLIHVHWTSKRKEKILLQSNIESRKTACMVPSPLNIEGLYSKNSEFGGTVAAKWVSYTNLLCNKKFFEELVAYFYMKLVSEAEDSLGIQTKRNVRCWNPLPSND